MGAASYRAGIAMPFHRALCTTVAVLGSWGWLAAGGRAQVTVTPTPLHAGVEVAREIASGAFHGYELELIAGQFADFLITIDTDSSAALPPDALTVTIRAADTVVRRVTRETASNGARRVCLVANRTGIY